MVSDEVALSHVAWRALEYGEVGVSFSFTVWTLVSWCLSCVVIFLVATLIRRQRRTEADFEALVAILATLTNEQSEMKIPETRQALREELQRRGWQAK